MDWPLTIDAISPSFLQAVLGREIVDVERESLGEPWTSCVTGLTVFGADGSVEKLVAKTARADRANPVLYQQEVRFYREVAERFPFVPRALFAESLPDGSFLLLLERIRGVHLRDGFDEDAARAVLTAIALVHGSCWGDDSLAPRREFSHERFRVMEVDAFANWARIKERFPCDLVGQPPLHGLADEVCLLPATTLTHNDLHAENILFDQGRPVLLDWQNATFSTPMLDVANVIAGCVQPEVQRTSWRALLAYYETVLVEAGGPATPDIEVRYATAVGMLFGWVCHYLAGVSDSEAAGRSMLLAHWERVCTGVEVRIR